MKSGSGSDRSAARGGAQAINHRRSAGRFSPCRALDMNRTMIEPRNQKQHVIERREFHFRRTERRRASSALCSRNTDYSAGAAAADEAENLVVKFDGINHRD